MRDESFSAQDVAKLEQEMRDKVLEHFSDQKEVIGYLEQTLSNFGYRYLESESTGKLNVSWILNEKGDCGKCEVIAFEDELSQCLKTTNKATRQGIIELAKSSKKSDKPSVKYTLGISWESLDEKKVHLVGYSEVNWGYPAYSKENSHHCEKEFIYDGPYSMRNNFPRDFEEVCDIL